jgi:nucleotide-binding universal stress UspA family protein
MKTDKIKKVLIALDYDETSQKVAETGFSLAKAMNAEIVLLHVISENPVYYSSYMYMRELKVDILSDLRKTTQEFLEKIKKQLGDASIHTVLKEGFITDTILETAKELDSDMIILGSHNRKWLETIIPGSVVEGVVKRTSIPLFIVPTRNSTNQQIFNETQEKRQYS